MADPKIRRRRPQLHDLDPEANRSIEQGNGVGARDLAAQREPTEAAEHDPFKERARRTGGVRQAGRDRATGSRRSR